jgi:hypothetical protein
LLLVLHPKWFVIVSLERVFCLAKVHDMPGLCKLISRKHSISL